MTSFAYRVLPPRTEFWKSLEPGDVALMAHYLDHLHGLRKDGTMRFVARSETTSGTMPGSTPKTPGFSLVLIEAEDEAHAAAIARTDPAVSEGLMRLERQPFFVVFDSAAASAQASEISA